MVGTLIGSYKLVRLLGQGGMGAVYEAVHQKNKTHVAIKLLHREHAANSAQLTRFFNEARAVNLIAHPALVAISDVGQLPDGSAYLVMELLNGESLSQHLKQRPEGLTETEALQITWPLASALDAAHKKNIVHRDLKPGNVMLVRDADPGRAVRLVDFGIAKLTGLDPDQPSTSTGTLLGTYYYMSPEQCRGAKVDGKSDVYSLGVMLYQLIAGRLPYHAETPIGVATMHLSEPVPTLTDAAPQASPAVSQLIYRMMSKDKNARPSMEEILVLLQQIDPTLATSVPKSLTPRSLAPEPERDPHTTRGISSGQAVASAPPNRRRNLGLLLGAAGAAAAGLCLWATGALHPTAGTAALRKDSAAPRPLAAPPAAAAAPKAATAPAAPSPPAQEAPLDSASRSSRGGRGKVAKSRVAKKKRAGEPTQEGVKAPATKPVKTVIID